MPFGRHLAIAVLIVLTVLTAKQLLSVAGDGAIVDGLVKDGLWDPYSNIHMGSCAEMCAERFGVSRQQQVSGERGGGADCCMVVCIIVLVGTRQGPLWICYTEIRNRVRMPWKCT